MRIIHLSDIHFSMKSLTQFENFILDTLINDLKKFNEKIKIDMIVITGDLVYKGGEEDINNSFLMFKEKFLNPLTSALNISLERVFFTPGNHDITRDEETQKNEIIEEGLKAILITPDKVNEFIERNDLESIKRIMEFKKFENNFYESYKNKQLSNFQSSFICEVSGKKIGISCLNSAWRCSKNDKGIILLGELQITNSLKFIKECDIKIGLIHHQLDELAEFDKESSKGYIEEEYDLLFCGHSHKGETENNVVEWNNIIVSVAPANWTPGVRSEDENYYNGYSIFDVDIYSGKVEIEYRKYSHKNGRKYSLNEKLGALKGKDSFELLRLKRNIKTETKDIILNSNEYKKSEEFYNHIPKPIPFFTGRTKELQQLREALEISNIVGLFAIGGTGKTTIATKYIEELPTKENVVWYECTESTSIDSVIEGTGYGEMLKSNPKSEREKLVNYVSLINRDSKIVFLDNFHTIRDKKLDNLLEYSSENLTNGKIVILSRDKYSNVSVNLKPISIDGLKEESLNYVKAIAQYREKETEISRFSDSELEEMCKQLKGHPLAISLALELIFEYGESCKGIKEKIAQYGDDSEKLSKRLIGFIFEDERLKEQEKEFLINISVFEGETEEEVIEYITNNEYRKYANIFIKKLMITKSVNSYELHSVIKEFCYEKLENKKDLHAKVAEYYIEKNSGEKIEGLIEEKIYFNLMKAKKYEDIKDRIILNGETLINSGYGNLIIDTISELRKNRVNFNEFYLFEGMIKQIHGEWKEARGLFKKCYNSERVVENIKIFAEIKYYEILSNMGELKESLEGLTKILKNIENLNYLKEIMECLNNIGMIYGTQGKYGEALKKYEESLEISKEIGDKSGIGACTNNIGTIYNNQGKYKEALKKYEESLEISKEIGNKLSLGTCINNIGQIYKNQGNYKEALEKYEESLEISKEIGDKSGIGTCINNIGEVYDSQGRYEEALEKYEESLEIVKEIGDKSGIGVCINNIRPLHKLIFYKSINILYFFIKKL